MPLTIGTRLGPHEIVAPIGAGGMGEEWQSSVASPQSPVGMRADDHRLATDDWGLTITSVRCR
jgi:hypothetical protein